MAGHIVTPKTYFTIFALLLVFTALTVSVAFIDLGPLNNVVALTIAVVKALLVILYFMHVRYSDKLTWAIVAAGFYWLLLLILITLSDFLTRGWIKIPSF